MDTFPFLFCLFFYPAVAKEQFQHNLPPGVELVDPASLGFDPSQIDLDSIIGNAGGAPGGAGNLRLLPISGQVDPETGLRTQVLTVGFDPSEDVNLDDFELPPSNQSSLVTNAFASFKDYLKKNGTKKPSVVMRRRKVVKPTTQQPKVIELDSQQIEKLLATGKLTSKKVGGSEVIEITQEQLNDLYKMENAEEIKSLLSGGIIQQATTTPRPSTTTPVTIPTTLVPLATTPVTIATVPVTTATVPVSTKPPIIYQFNTNDFQRNQPQRSKPNSFEFISVPPVSFRSTVLEQPQSPRQQVFNQSPRQPLRVQFSQDPLPSGIRSQVSRPEGNFYFPSNSRAYRNMMNTYYPNDGLNYQNGPSINSFDYLRGI